MKCSRHCSVVKQLDANGDGKLLNLSLMGIDAVTF